MSKTIRTLAITAGAALAIGALSTGVALAAGPAPQVPSSVTTVAPTPGSAIPDSPEQAGTSEQSGAPESDGPGGHTAPPGNVDHQFNGTE